jgi:hypothetical protein
LHASNKVTNGGTTRALCEPTTLSNESMAMIQLGQQRTTKGRMKAGAATSKTRRSRQSLGDPLV